MAKDKQPENQDSFENKDNFGTFNDYSLDYDDDIEEKKEEKPFVGEYFKEIEDKPKEDPYDVLNDQYTLESKEENIPEEEPKQKKKTFSFLGNTNKLVKYAIYGFAGLIVLILLIGIFSSGGGSKKKETFVETLELGSGEKYSFANEVGEYQWTSSDNDVATVNNTGEIEAISDGNTIITITTNDKILEYQVHVKKVEEIINVTSVKMATNSLELENGKDYTMQVSVYPKEAPANGLSWFSSNESVAVVDSNGKITAVGVGNCTITVKSSNGNSDVCFLKVTNGDGTVGEIDEIILDVTNIVLKSGIKYTINYQLVPPSAKGEIVWESSDDKIASVEDGVITTNNQGTVSIVAKNGDIKQTLYVTVVKGANLPDIINDGKTVYADSITLNQTSMALEVGKTYTLVAAIAPENVTSKTVTWTTSNSNIVKVDSNGNIQAVGVGNAIVTVATDNGKTANCNITVKDKTEIHSDYKISLNLNTVTLKVNDTTTLTPTITPNNYPSGVTWSSSNTSVATVSNGVIKALKSGTTVITASLSNGAKATCTVNVASSTSSVVNPIIVKLNVERVELKTNGTSQLSATILPTNATNKTIKWSSSNSSVATVDANGKVTAKSNGTAIITATASNGIKSQATIVVNAGASIKFAKTSVTVGVNKSTTIATTVINASKKDIKWSSSNTSVATVSSSGIITGKKAGKAVITATVSGASAKCTVTVKATGSAVAPLIELFPSAVSITDDNLYDNIIEANNRLYKVYKQRYFRGISYGVDGNVADNGDAAVALSIILSGYKDIDPVQVASYMEYNSFDRIVYTADHYGMSVDKILYYDSTINDSDKYNVILSDVKAHLESGNPIIAYVSEATNSSCEKYKYSGSNHFIALLGLHENGELIVGNPGLKDGSGTIEELLSCYMKGQDKGLIFLKNNE